MFKKINKSLKFGTILAVSVLLVAGFSISLQSLLAAWTAPTAEPPTDNVNSLSIGGNLGAGGNMAIVGNSTLLGNIGIGTSSDSNYKLKVSGGIVKTLDGLEIETRSSDPVNPANGRIWLKN